MKKLALIALIAFAAWNYFQTHRNAEKISAFDTHQSSQTSTQEIQAQAITFSCDGRQHCSQMNSRAEAEYFLRNCPNTKMDGDHDGIPCENDSRF